MLLIVSAFGIVAQLILYHPMSGVIIATSAMIIWLVAFGGISAMSYVLLAKLNKDPGKSGLAAGLISQLSSLACFFAPTIYFSLQFWPEFLSVAIAGLAVAILVFPRSARAS